jgi:superfamily I DNA and/or RNA helicase
LSEIGHHKQMLDEQYRMYPCISKFPNDNFYGGKIKDGTKPYGNFDIYLGSIFQNYSFIHVEGGTEKHVCTSFVNKIEAVVAEKIVDKLAEGIFS